jgi:hypothetical protein
MARKGGMADGLIAWDGRMARQGGSDLETKKSCVRQVQQNGWIVHGSHGSSFLKSSSSGFVV